MKIIYRTGDLLEADEPVIACDCSACGVMDSGVAKAIRDRYPVTYKMYRNQYDDPEGLNLRDTIWVYCGRHVVVNTITQQNHGADVDYDAIRSAMKEINGSRLWNSRLLAGKTACSRDAAHRHRSRWRQVAGDSPDHSERNGPHPACGLSA